ncbi:hypothetical protein GCM10011512_12710 [Tersicoccus solisilvae]|uniref:DUF998 domain-containing protein n=1 Tax=Tersicoccus solisilvae TaxID=1882339 RepID=A0ABQ1NY13_9MICC|nr:hypothetical protein [Tersicoccus solisilvae]GGC87250.1 hypothetical protein GCM10011512_12710 [Tersicoccus solisilvae]
MSRTVSRDRLTSIHRAPRRAHPRVGVAGGVPRWRHPLVVTTAVVAAGVWLALMAANVLYYTGPHEGALAVFDSPRFNGDNDRSWPEVAGYAAMSVATLAMIGLAVRRRRAVYAAWALVFAVMTADDSYALHERGAKLILQHVSLPSIAGLRPQDAGELGVWAGGGLVLAALVVLAHRRADALGRQDTRRLALLLVALAVFAVGIDMGAELLARVVTGEGALAWLALIESGGELFVMCLIAVTSLAMLLRRTSR